MGEGPAGGFRGKFPGPRLKTEIIRKAIHLLIVPVLPLAAWSRTAALGLLLAGLGLYLLSEGLRMRGRDLPLIAFLTRLASRPRDGDRLILGPVTWLAGAFLTLLVFPPRPAGVGILALALGDGLASVAGTFFLSLRYRDPFSPPGKSAGGRLLRALTSNLGFLGEKTTGGSLACFMAVWAGALGLGWPLGVALWLALITTVLEALPLKDMDNVLVPVGSALGAWGFLILG
ncbi:MAG: phosphatidate cytidylyltransferase [Spirochaetales bacterium]|jgi:dolichol kinase|nr:phosphatidate cytidylyltransferase [Spirochaetales bacterium]